MNAAPDVATLVQRARQYRHKEGDGKLARRDGRWCLRGHKKLSYGVVAVGVWLSDKGVRGFLMELGADPAQPAVIDAALAELERVLETPQEKPN